MGEYVNINKDLVSKLRNDVVDLNQEIDFERTQFTMESYEKYNGYPSIIVRARAFENLLKNKKIYIDDNLFVGSVAGKPGGMYLFPEWNVYSLKDGEFPIPEEYEDLIEKTIEYWEPRCLFNRGAEEFERKYNRKPDVIRDGTAVEINSAPAGGGNTHSFKGAEVGLRSMINEVEERLKVLDSSAENNKKRNFYEAEIIVLEALIAYANRYADLAEQMAADETDESKKAELLLKAEICRHVPEHPARNFREAVQAFWFVHLGEEIEQVGCSVSPGYLGQYLEPYYQKDKKEGKVSYDEAVYIIQHLFIKMNDINYYYGQALSLTNSNDLGQAVSLGGYTENGKDATAELDYAILDAQMELQLVQPPLALMYHPKLDPAIVRKSLELVATGCGMPQFMNTDVVVSRSLEAYSRYGATLGDARRSCVFGCVTTGIINKTAFFTEGNMSLAKPLELVLFNGIDPVFQDELGIKTGDPTKFKDFEALYNAYLEQVKFVLHDTREYGRIGDCLCAEYLQVPFRSAFVDGCIENGLDLWNGGAYFTAPSFVFGCGTDAANGLKVIKQLVYDEKRLTMEELIEALKNDFKGYEGIQKMCLQIPKHGNGDKEAEEIMQRLYEDVGRICVEDGPDYLGRYTRPDAFSKSVHNHYGLFTGAYPTGRNAGVAFTDGSVSAMPGSDIKGPTTLALDAAKGIDTIAYDSAHLNMKLAPNQFDEERGYQAVNSLIKGFMAIGGNHVQFNCVDKETLIDAQKNPENHKDLLVRVAGFSAYFVRLHKGVQDEIIARTEHAV